MEGDIQDEDITRIADYIVDVAGQGKIPVPLGYWDNADLTKCKDYNGKSIYL